jgi:hypothetical protein
MSEARDVILSEAKDLFYLNHDQGSFVEEILRSLRSLRMTLSPE